MAKLLIVAVSLTLGACQFESNLTGNGTTRNNTASMGALRGTVKTEGRVSSRITEAASNASGTFEPLVMATGSKWRGYCQYGYCTTSCFPGTASVTVKGVGEVPLKDLRSGEHVLVKSGKFEPVLGFLHATEAGSFSKFLTVEHSHGRFDVSPYHVVFVDNTDKLAMDLVPGDKLLLPDNAGGAQREILSVVWNAGRTGMFAPLTPSGTVVVDGIVASNYASYAHVTFPHSAFHGAFFPVRAWHALGLASVFGDLFGSPSTPPTTESLHPYASALWTLVGPMATKIF